MNANAKLIATLPIEASASGSNAYYAEFCNFCGHRPSYAACLGRIRNGASSNFNECTTAIQRRHCPALELRAEEIEAGQAIYYVDRNAVHAEIDIRLSRQGVNVNRDNRVLSKLEAITPAGGFKVGQLATITAVPTSPKSAKTEREVSDYAAAINKAMSTMGAEKPSIPKSNTVLSQPSVSADLSNDQVKPRARAAFKATKGMTLAEIAAAMNSKSK